MPKKEVKSPERKPAQELLQQFLKANNIILDFEVKKNRFVDSEDGFILVPMDKPVVVIRAEYE